MRQSYLAVSLCSLSAAAFFCASSTCRQPEAGKAGQSSQEHSIAQIAPYWKHALAKLYTLRCLDTLAIIMFIMYACIDLYSYKEGRVLSPSACCPPESSQAPAAYVVALLALAVSFLSTSLSRFPIALSSAVQ